MKPKSNHVKKCKYRKKLNKTKLNFKQKSIFVEKILVKKISTAFIDEIVDNTVDNVDNYSPRRFSPTDTMSPAPIVINRSPFIQFCNKKFSTSSKDSK